MCVYVVWAYNNSKGIAFVFSARFGWVSTVFKWFSNASLRKTILCSHSFPLCSDSHSRVLYFPSHIVYSIHPSYEIAFCVLDFHCDFFFLGNSKREIVLLHFCFRETTPMRAERAGEKKNKIKIKLPKRNRYQELFNAIVCMCVPVSIIAMGRYAILCFSCSLLRLKTEPKKKTRGKNIIKYYIIFVHVCECFTI